MGTPSETTSSLSEDLKPEFIFQDRSSEDNANIIAMRSEVLLGKTVQGTLIKTIRKSGKTTFWVRWNKRKCDAVLVRSDLIENALGTTDPKEGTQISCKIVAWDRISPSCSSNLPGVCTHKPTKLRSFLTGTSTRLTRSSRLCVILPVERSPA